MINLKAIITVEFSLNQKCFHVDTVDKVLKTNLMSLCARKQTDFTLIGIFESYEDADAFIDLYRTRLKLDDYVIYTDVQGNMHTNTTKY